MRAYLAPLRSAVFAFAIALLFVAAVGDSARAATITWDFNVVPVDWTSVQGAVVAHSGDGQTGVSAAFNPGNLNIAHDGQHENVVFRSPTFELDGTGNLTFQIHGGGNSSSSFVYTNTTQIPIGNTQAGGNGHRGVGLRDVLTGNYVLSGNRANDGGGWDTVTFSQAALSTYANDGRIYTVDYVDTYHGGWGWNILDNLSVPGFLSSGAPTQIWANGADGNWSTGTWNPANPTTPDGTTKTKVNTPFTVTVDGARTTQQFTAENQGKLLIGAGNSLTVTGAISVAAVSSGSGVTMDGNSTLSAQSGSVNSLSAGGNVAINVTGAGQTVTVPVYTASAPSVLTKGGPGTLALTNTAHSADPLGANTTGIVLNGGTLSLDNSTTVTTNNALKASLYYNPYSPNPQLRFEQAGSILSQSPFQTASDTGLGNANGAGINYNGNNSPSGNNFNALFPGMTNFDDFQVAWTGFLTAPATGNYNLYSYWADNAYSVYVDLNQDGVFTLNEERWEANTGSGSNGNFNLTAGQKYKVAFGFAEQGGDQNVGFYIDTPGAGNFNVNPSNGSQSGWWSYDTTNYGALNMAGKSVTVTASSTLNLGTDQAVTFGALNANGGTATITGALPSLSFTSTTVAPGVTSGVSAAPNKVLSLGPVNIGAGGTLVVGGQASATSTTLAASGGVQVASGGTYNVGSYNDGAVARTFTTGGAGTTVLNNSGGAIVAASTTFRVEGGTLDATNSGLNDPLGGSNSIQLAGGTLKLQGTAAVVNGLTASLYYTTNRDSIRFHNPGSLFTMTPVQTVTDTGLGNSNGPGINYNGDAAWQALFPAKAQNDNFSVLWTGYLNAPASGTYNLNSYWSDDAYSVYVDLNQDNIFTANEMRSEGGLGGGQGSFNLTGGQAYKVALGYREDGGDQNVGYRIYGPGAYNDTNVNPSHANQAGMWTSVGYGALSFASKNIEVLANSELNALSDTSASFGALTFNNGVLTVSGNPSTSFASTTVNAAATQVGFISTGEITSGPIVGNNFTGDFVKGGSGNFTLNNANSGLANATFDVQGGRLTALNAAGLGGSTNAKLSGGQLFLSSNGGDQAYNIAMDVTQNSTLTVGKATVGGVNAPVNITVGSPAKNLVIRNGKTLTVNATDSYTMDLNNSLNFEDNSTMTISGAGVDVNILGATTLTMGNNSTLNLNSGTMHTDHAISVYNLNLNGGVLSLEGAGANKSLHVNGTLTVNNGATNLDLTAGALLTTAGNATINLQNGTITTDSALNVGNLTVEAGGTLNRTGALPANRNVSVGDRLRLVNKNFSTVGSALSVGNRIELDNSTLAFDNNLSLNSVWMNSNSQFNPGAGTTTTINDVIEVYNGSTADFTGATLALTNRFRLDNNATLKVGNNLSLNGTLEVYNNSLVDFGANSLTTNYQNIHIAGNNAELRATSSGVLNINFLQIWDTGKLNVPTVRINDATWLGRGTHAFNITENGGGKRLEAHHGGVDDYNTNRHVYLTGTNAYTGETQMHDATVLVAQQGVGLPNASMIRFQNGVLGTSGVFAREIGDGVDGGGLGRVRFNSWGGFAAFGGPLTVSLNTANPGDVIDWNSYDNGFNGQGLRLGAAFDTHDVTITNPININQGIHIEARSSEHLGILAGNLTGNGDFNKNEGKGTIALTGNNSGYTGNIHIRRGALDVGANGVGLGGTNVVYLRHDTGDPWNWGAAIIQANGVLNKNIGQSAGEIYWEQEGGGFAARGGNLTVTLEGGADINWNDGNAGFNGRQLMFGSTTADSVVTLTNNLNAQNSYRRITVIGNPNSPNDKAVLAGTLTDFRGFELRGTGTLEIPHDFTDIHDDQLRVYQGTLSVLGNVRSGNAYGGGDPRHVGSSDNNIEIREGGKLLVTGNAQGNFIYIEDNGTVSDTSSINITGNLNARDRLETNNGTVTIGGNITTGEGYNIRNKSNVVINGNARVGAPNGNSADRDVYVENGGDLTFNGNVQTNRLQATGKNSNGRASTIHVNGIAMVGNDGNSNMHFNADNPTTGGGLNGSGVVNFNYADFHNGATLGGTLTLNIRDRIEFHGSNSILSPGNSAGTLTFNGTLQLNGGSHYYFDAGDMVDVNTFASSNTGSQLIAHDGWNLDLKAGGARFAAGGSIDLFRYDNLGSFDLTPNFNVADIISAGWVPNNFDTGTLSLSASGGVVTLNGLRIFIPPSVWNGGGSDNNWTTSANWDSLPVAGGAVSFAGSTRTTPNNDFAPGTSFDSIGFAANAASFTLNGNAIALTGGITNSSANDQTINMAINLPQPITVDTGAQNMLMSGNLSGAGGLTKSGAGKLTLSGINSQNGTTTIQQGTLAVADNSALGANTATLRFAGGTLQTLAGITSSRPIDITSAGGTVDTNGFNSTLSGPLSGTGSLAKTGAGALNLTGTSTNTSAMNVNGGTLRGNTDNLKGNVVLANGGSVAFNQTANGVYSKVVSGAGNLIKEGNAVLTMQSAATYTGDTMISGGVLKLESNPGFRYYRFQNDLSFANNNEYQLSEMAFYSAGTNNNNGTRVTPVGFFAQPGANYGDQGIAGMYDDSLGTKCFMNGNGGQPIWFTFDFGAAFNATGYDWATANDATPGRNPHDWAVYGSNDNTNFTLIDTQTGQGGTPTNTFTWAPGWALNLGGGGPAVNFLPTTTNVVMLTGTALDLNSINQEIGSLSGAAGSSVTNSGTSDVTLRIGGSTNANFSGVISDGATNDISLIKSGSGTQTLSGINTYTGPTDVQGGTLRVNGSLAAISDVTVQSGATLGGSGVIGGDVTALSGSHVAPGNSPESLEVFGNFSLLSGSFLDIELGLGDPSTFVLNSVETYDRTKVYGTTTLEGDLNVSLIDGKTLVNGELFGIFDRDGGSFGMDVFANLAEGDLVLTDASVNLYITYLGNVTDGSVSQTGGNDIVLYAIGPASATVPEPTSVAMWCLLGAMGVIGYRRRRK